jgi:hypothetical protein
MTEGQHSPHVSVDRESSSPQQQQLSTSGHTLAATLFLCFSCAPLLKQHTLRLLQVTKEEFDSIEPVIVEAYNSWNHQVRLYSLYAQRLQSNLVFSATSIPRNYPPMQPNHRTSSQTFNRLSLSQRKVCPT